MKKVQLWKMGHLEPKQDMVRNAGHAINNRAKCLLGSDLSLLKESEADISVQYH